MSTFTKSIKINGAVHSTGNYTIGTHGVYSAPASGYAIVQLATPNTVGTFKLKINSAYITTTSMQTVGLQKNTTGTIDQAPTIYIGPSQTLYFEVVSGSVQLDVSGVEFVS